MNEELFDKMDRKKEKKSVSIFVFLLIILLLGSLFASYYFFSKYNQIKKNPDIVSQGELNSVLKSVSKLMVLPGDEEPSMATIIDKSQLAGQPFFSSAENGDKLLIFPQTMQAVIYRPSTNKIIKAGPIFVNQTGQINENSNVNQVQNIPPEVSGVKVAYYNGTSIQNLSAQTESVVKLNYPEYQTAIVTNANNIYTENTIFDISGNNNEEVKRLAALLNAKVISSLPEGESKPDADILIISGQ